MRPRDCPVPSPAAHGAGPDAAGRPSEQTARSNCHAGQATATAWRHDAASSSAAQPDARGSTGPLQPLAAHENNAQHPHARRQVASAKAAVAERAMPADATPAASAPPGYAHHRTSSKNLEHDMPGHPGGNQPAWRPGLAASHAPAPLQPSDSGGAGAGYFDAALQGSTGSAPAFHGTPRSAHADLVNNLHRTRDLLADFAQRPDASPVSIESRILNVLREQERLIRTVAAEVGVASCNSDANAGCEAGEVDSGRVSIMEARLRTATTKADFLAARVRLSRVTPISHDPGVQRPTAVAAAATLTRWPAQRRTQRWRTRSKA